MNKTYEVKFNDFGVCYVIAKTFNEAESKFIASGNMGDKGRITSIIAIPETNEPII